MPMEVVRLVNTPVSSNCFLLYDKRKGNGCVVVDPGFERPERFEMELGRLGLIPRCVVLTHEHFDHVWGCGYLTDRYSTPILCSAACAKRIGDPKKNLSLFYDQKGFAVRGTVSSVESLDFVFDCDGMEMSFFLAPGHSDGGICMTAGRYLFTGDTLLCGLRTVTKLYCGSKEKLGHTLDKMRELQGNGYLVCPGHGECFQLDGYDLRKALL